MATPKTPRAALPFRGVSDKFVSEDQPGEFTTPDGMRNVLAFSGERGEHHLGTRWGLAKLFKDQFGGGKAVQSFAVVERAAGQTGLQAGPSKSPLADSRNAGKLGGHCFVIDPTTSMIVAIKNNAAIGGLAFTNCWHPTQRRVCFACVTSVSGRAVTSLVMFDVDTRMQVWTQILDNGASTTLANQIAVGDRYTFVGCNDKIYVLLTDTGAILVTEDLAGWSYEVNSLAIRPDGKLVVAFWGTGKAGTMPNQVISQTLESSFYRSGVMLFDVNNNDSAPLTRRRFGPALDASDPWFEADHGYARFGEILGRGHRGAIPYALAVGPNNETVVGMTNKGWGWNQSYAPDDTSTDWTTVAVFDPEGNLLYQKDTESRRVPYTGPWGVTWHNDIPQIDADDNIPATGTPKASVVAVAVDANGDIYTAGQRNAAGFNVFKLSGGVSGSVQWRYDAGSMVEQHGIAIDPADGNLWVAVMRNNSYGSAGGVSALLLKLNAITGALLKKYDISPAPTYGAWGISVNSLGEVAFVTDYI